jgi:hypothetical protein
LDIEVNAYRIQPASQSAPIPEEITSILFVRFVTISAAKSFLLGALRACRSRGDAVEVGHTFGKTGPLLFLSLNGLWRRRLARNRFVSNRLGIFIPTAAVTSISFR